MKILTTKIFPEYEGIDTTQEIEIPNSISWELRFYCDECSDEIAEIDLKNHKCNDFEF